MRPGGPAWLQAFQCSPATREQLGCMCCMDTDGRSSPPKAVGLVAVTLLLLGSTPLFT